MDSPSRHISNARTLQVLTWRESRYLHMKGYLVGSGRSVACGLVRHQAFGEVLRPKACNLKLFRHRCLTNMARRICSPKAAVVHSASWLSHTWLNVTLYPQCFTLRRCRCVLRCLKVGKGLAGRRKGEADFLFLEQHGRLGRP